MNGVGLAAIDGLSSSPLQGTFSWYALVFVGLAVVAAIVGLQNISGMSMRIARIFVGIFLVLAVVSLFL